MASLAEIRAKLQAMENNNSSNKPTNNDSTLYPFWNIEEGSTATFRFLPDLDQDNTFFWVERQVIKLTFPGVIGEANGKQVTVQVPCGEMYGDTCPVLTEVRPWFKDPSLEEMGRKYWKKRSYIFQGFVTDDPMNEEAPANPIRRFIIGPQIYNIIKSALMDPDMEALPTDYSNGVDFRLTKASKGGYADYGTSKWARKERSLTDEELAAIDEHGLFDLKSFLPARPTQEHYQVIAEMFEASVNGDLYDPRRWGNFYKPYGLEVPADAAPAPSAGATKPTPAPAATPKVEAPKVEATAPAATDKDETPWDDAPAETVTKVAEAEAPAGDKKPVDDILAMIRNRSKA